MAPRTVIVPTAEAERQVDVLMTWAWPDWRPARSPEYVAGMRALLTSRTVGTPLPASPHAQRTAAFDAWYAGVEEGSVLWSRVQAKGAQP